MNSHAGLSPQGQSKNSAAMDNHMFLEWLAIGISGQNALLVNDL